MDLDPYPWVHPSSGGRYGSEYPKHDGLPMTHLGLEFRPNPNFSQNRADYPEGLSAETIAYARGYHEGYARGYEDAQEDSDES